MGQESEAALLVHRIDNLLSAEVMLRRSFLHVVGKIVMEAYAHFEAHQDQDFPVKTLLVDVKSIGHVSVIVEADEIQPDFCRPLCDLLHRTPAVRVN